MATTQDIKKGICIQQNGDIWSIVDFQHVKPGKGGAFVRTKMKSLTSGKVVDNTYNSGETIDMVSVERRPHQFLYKDETGFNFMDQNSFEQVSIPDIMVENADLMKEGQEVEISFHAENERPLSVDLPPFVTLEIIYSEPGVKGDTANNPMKWAELETGAKIQVPLFVESGTRIKVDTRDRSYSERVKD